MNLLIIPSWYPSKRSPINGIFFREQAVALSRGGHNVTLIDVSLHGRKDWFNSKNFRLTYQNDEGVHVYSLKIPSFALTRFLPAHLFIFKFLLFFVFLKLIKKGQKFDVIHAHSFCPAGYCASKLSEKYNIPLVVTEHFSGLIHAIPKKKESQLLTYTVSHCYKFICVSETLLKNVEKFTNISDNLLVVPNIVSSLFSYSDIKRTDNDFVFFSIGFLIDRKRFALTISCFNQAFKDCPNVKLRIAGSGELYGTLQKQIDENNLTEKVQLLGQLKREQIKAELDNCDAFVLASAAETFGVVYIEAMACGKPVIATRNGGANDIVNETNGILIDIDNEEQLIKAFQEMYQNADKFNNRQISDNCYAKYSEKNIVEQLTKIYEEIKK